MPSTSTCQGVATLWSTHTSFPGPKQQPFHFDAGFESRNGRWTVTRFEPILIPDVDSPLGKLKVTVALLPPTAGAWDAATGAMSVGARFEFRFSKPAIRASTLEITLDTDNAHRPPPHAVQGARLNAATGAVTLAGVGTFTNGVLIGVQCAIQLTGTFAPLP
jgi:hypothetical protein